MCLLSVKYSTAVTAGLRHTRTGDGVELVQGIGDGVRHAGLGRIQAEFPGPDKIIRSLPAALGGGRRAGFFASQPVEEADIRRGPIHPGHDDEEVLSPEPVEKPETGGFSQAQAAACSGVQPDKGAGVPEMSAEEAPSHLRRCRAGPAGFDGAPGVVHAGAGRTFPGIAPDDFRHPEPGTLSDDGGAGPTGGLHGLQAL